MQGLWRLGAVVAAVVSSPLGVDAADLENLIVSANRTTQPATSIGSSVSVIDREMIEERKPVFVTDLLQDLPGIAVSRAGPFGAQTQLRIRGGEANHVLVFIDGVQANDPTASDEFTFEQLTSWDVERIEVVRGPQSALWGSDAMAGVINITTRRSQAPRQIGAFAETGSFGSTFFGGHAGASFNRGTVDLSASAYDTDGDNISRGGNEDDGYENLTASMSGSFQATEALSLSLFGRYSDATNDLDEFTFATGLPSDAPLQSDVELFLFRAAGNLALLDKRWNHQLQFTYAGSDRKNKDSRALPDPVDYEGDRYGFYYQTSYDFAGSLPTNRLTLAIDHERDDYQQSGDLQFGSDPNQNQEMDNTGLIAEYLLQPLDALNLSASVRYDDNSDFDDETTWRLAGTWRFARTDTRLRASAGTGQKAPTFVERFGFFRNDAFFTGNPNLQPEESTGFDIGVTQGLFGGRAQAEITYFSDRVEDEINGFVFDPVTGGATAENENGTSRRQGAEFDLRARLPANLDAQVTYTYTNAKEPDGSGGDRREIRRPEHMAALNLNYRFLDDRARLNLNVSYTGEQDDEYFPPTGPQTVELDDYALVNLVASYDISERFSVYARADNLFDENYENVLGYQSLGDGYYAGVRMRLR